jgi:CRP-like cAMP-binding protein
MTLRLQIYALALFAFVLGMLRWRSAYADAKLAEMDRKQAEVRLDAALRKMEKEHEIETLGDVGLGERAARWLRPDADR